MSRLTASVVVRPATESDVLATLDIYNHYVRTSPATFDLEPHTLEGRLEWFSHYAPTGRHRLFVAEQATVVQGYATSSRFRPRAAYDTSVEVSVYVRDEARGQGIGGRLYAALFEAIASEDLHRAYAGITLPNPASVALHERFGFTRMGVMHEVGRKFDRYWDVAMLEKRLPAPAS